MPYLCWESQPVSAHSSMGDCALRHGRPVNMPHYWPYVLVACYCLLLLSYWLPAPTNRGSKYLSRVLCSPISSPSCCYLATLPLFSSVFFVLATRAQKKRSKM